ncbi:MAG: KUP/HAK/KT family potassium transporter [Bacteroidetes bacterium]|jgi:KUP system potassium uptake protein|nr:KUP/HAK/KT family potassium transporter [Bacteroidota bacterium]
MASGHINHSKVTTAGMLVTLGIVYGDIGTSPLYVMSAVIGSKPIEESLVLGGLSCVFWTLTILTTLKYIILTLRADNKGEGGIFSLYALVRKMHIKWLAIPAMIGGAALLADGIITPPISVSSAIEGLKVINPDIPTVPIVTFIIFALFFIQQFGTRFVGRFFGPVMLVWFSMLLILGVIAIFENPVVFKAINPYYAYHLLTSYPEGFWILGAVFLCTTGAEALYTDLGHCGRNNIRVSWGFVKVALLANYFGQGAWLLNHTGKAIEGIKPFYALMPDWFVLTGIIIATSAAIVASQSFISGIFTLINEGMRLDFLPKGRIEYPTDLRGQLYIPTINWLLCLGCIGIVLYFQQSSKMEAAYGLSIIITMLMTTLLLTYYLYLKKYNRVLIGFIFVVLMCIEIAFLVANLSKFSHGGYVTIIILAVIVAIMWVWYEARKIRTGMVEFVKLEKYFEIISDVSKDETIPKYATHLVYLTSARTDKEVENKIIYSILQKQPKRADVYWLVHVDVVDEPYTLEYSVKELVEDKIVHVRFKIGFRIEPRINLMFRQVVQELVERKEVDITSRYASLNKEHLAGDFRFIVMEKFLSYENTLKFYTKFILNIYFFMKRMSLSEEKAFGLDSSTVLVEKVPLIVTPPGSYSFTRVY